MFFNQAESTLFKNVAGFLRITSAKQSFAWRLDLIPYLKKPDTLLSNKRFYNFNRNFQTIIQNLSL